MATRSVTAGSPGKPAMDAMAMVTDMVTDTVADTVADTEVDTEAGTVAGKEMDTAEASTAAFTAVAITTPVRLGTVLAYVLTGSHESTA